MINQRMCKTENDTLHLLHQHNKINRDIIAANAPKSLQVTGISWNKKGNMLLYTGNGFLPGDFTLYQATIIKAVQEADASKLPINVQDTWLKLTIHGISLEAYPDTPTSMADLKREQEFGNTNLQFTTESL